MSESSFALPIRLMPHAHRHAVQALYQWCKKIDDAADHPQLALAAKHQQLKHYEAELEHLFAGQRVPAALAALQPLVQQQKLGKETMVEILRGVQMDVQGDMFKPTLAQLDHYCYRVASCVGLCVMQLMGDLSPQAQAFAIHLGHALQRTNILRDVLTDAQQGRCYLPIEWLRECGLADINPEVMAQHVVQLQPAIRKLSDAAMVHYEAADVAARQVATKPITALLMRDIYQRLLVRMQDDGWRYHKPYTTTLPDRLWLLWRYVGYRLTGG